MLMLMLTMTTTTTTTVRHSIGEKKREKNKRKKMNTNGHASWHKTIRWFRSPPDENWSNSMPPPVVSESRIAITAYQLSPSLRVAKTSQPARRTDGQSDGPSRHRSVKLSRCQERQGRQKRQHIKVSASDGRTPLFVVPLFLSFFFFSFHPLFRSINLSPN